MLVNLGGEDPKYWHGIRKDRIYAILAYKGNGVKRAVREFNREKLVIDLRAGARAKSVILMDNRVMFLSPHSAKLLISKLNADPIGVLSAGRGSMKAAKVPAGITEIPGLNSEVKREKQHV